VRNGDQWHVTATHDDGSLTATRTTRPGDAGEPETVRLPAAYVAEHVDLGYATTTHRAQGVTVESAHLLAAPGMTREALYVGMTRGRHANQVYVALDRIDPDCDTLPDPHHIPNGREVLDRILTTTGAEASATQTHTRNLDDAGSLHHLQPIHTTLTADAAARHWAALLPASGLTPTQVDSIDASPHRAALFTALTRGHHAGHDMPQVLRRLVAQSPVGDDDAAGALGERLTGWLDDQSEDPRRRPEQPRTGGLVDPDDPAEVVLQEVEDLIRQRISALTQLAVLERPSWMVTYGPEPDPGPAHEAWLAQVAAHAAHLDRTNPHHRPSPSAPRPLASEPSPSLAVTRSLTP
jgi:hypothetical protein